MKVAREQMNGDISLWYDLGTEFANQTLDDKKCLFVIESHKF